MRMKLSNMLFSWLILMVSASAFGIDYFDNQIDYWPDGKKMNR